MGFVSQRYEKILIQSNLFFYETYFGGVCPFGHEYINILVFSKIY